MKLTVSIRAGIAALLCGAVLTAGCSTSRTFVDYSRGSLYSTETAGNVPYVEIGPVAASQRGFFWEPCWQLAEKTVEQMRASADERGANNVIAVRWLNHADGSFTETPICTTGWGWFTALIAPGFGPWVKVAEARGRLVHAEESSLLGLKQELGRRMAGYQKRMGENAAKEPAPQLKAGATVPAPSAP